MEGAVGGDFGYGMWRGESQKEHEANGTEGSVLPLSFMEMEPSAAASTSSLPPTPPPERSQLHDRPPMYRVLSCNEISVLSSSLCYHRPRQVPTMPHPAAVGRTIYWALKVDSDHARQLFETYAFCRLLSSAVPFRRNGEGNPPVVGDAMQPVDDRVAPPLHPKASTDLHCTLWYRAGQRDLAAHALEDKFLALEGAWVALRLLSFLRTKNAACVEVALDVPGSLLCDSRDNSAVKIHQLHQQLVPLHLTLALADKTPAKITGEQLAAVRDGSLPPQDIVIREEVVGDVFVAAKLIRVTTAARR